MAHWTRVWPRARTNIIGMIHVPALPGTPASRLSLDQILAQTEAEARIYRRCGLDGLILENMHDRPYVLPADMGPETTAGMAVVARHVRALMPPAMPVGVQILAGANRAALAVAHCAGLQFIRAEGFVFGHLGDEGWFEACAGPLLRYRRRIGAESVAIWSDLKKKHSAHAVTADVSLAETAAAADFFLADGLVVTGSSTGLAAEPAQVGQVQAAAPDRPVFVGSGVTARNVADYAHAQGLIIGSHFKVDGHWSQPLDERRIQHFMSTCDELRRQ